MAILFSFVAATVACAQIDPSLASRYFQEAKWASDDYGGSLWGKPLYGPMMFVDPKTRAIVANQGDGEGLLKPSGPVWVGTLPADIPPANTSIRWAGMNWTMVMWPLPETPAERTLLMIHECFHRIQKDIGLPPAGPANNQLDTLQGRRLLRLEWRALSVALISWGPERRQALTDALTFRAYRRSLFPGSAAEEDRMEVHEGMAEYTGVRLMGLGDWGRRSFIAGRMKVSATKPSYTKSFAYETGPAYGLLLDMTATPWRSKLTPASSLSDLTRTLNQIDLPTDLAKSVAGRAAAYNDKQILAEEQRREDTRKAREANYRKKLVTGPVLEIALDGGNFTYDPNAVFPMKEGYVYPESHISGPWGALEVTGGVLMSPKFDRIRVPAPADATKREGLGWKLTVNPGWTLGKGDRPGDFKLVRER